MPTIGYDRTIWEASDYEVISNCPDARNFMFPASLDDYFEGFSDQQLDLIRRNLMLFPH